MNNEVTLEHCSQCDWEGYYDDCRVVTERNEVWVSCPQCGEDTDEIYLDENDEVIKDEQ